MAIPRNYTCDGQMDVFTFLNTYTQNLHEFNVIESLALRGTGFANGMEMVKEYFEKENSLSERAKFLKKEYGIGGFGSPVKKPNYIHSFDTYSSSGRKGDMRLEYYDENMQNCEMYLTFTDLAKAIGVMISENRYIKKQPE